MNGTDEVYENTASLLAALGRFPGTRYFAGRAAAFYDSGANDAYENYALIDPACSTRQKNEETIMRGLEFFARSGHAHIWPIFPGEADDACVILEGCGLVRDEDFRAMAAETSEAGRIEAGREIVEAVRGDDDIREWADCVWRGFDSDDDAPERFVSNARSMAGDGAFTLVRVGRKAAGMLYVSGATCGIYNVATRPEFRGHGLAGTVIGALKVLARRMGHERVVLLATPPGFKLYLKHGFADLGAVKIYRMDSGYNRVSAIY